MFFPTTLLLLGVAFGTGKSGMTPPDDPLVVAVHWDETRQTIRGFGASGAWSTQFVGTWPSAKKNQVADWLFG